jgi:hypothetical protein
MVLERVEHGFLATLGMATKELYFNRSIAIEKSGFSPFLKGRVRGILPIFL